jgi:ABC-type sulfate/molybdate transport systems ATPase subunit
VRANVETGLRFHRVPREEARDRAAAWMERLGIAELAGRRALTLSGGEQQRVSLARALVLGPRLLLLDEPFAGLDAATTAELLADLHGLLEGAGTTTLFATHDRHEAAALARRIAVLHAGEVRQEGPAAHVLDHPADAACARTLGYDTLLPAAAAERLLGAGAGMRALRAEDCRAEPPGPGSADEAGAAAPPRPPRPAPGARAERVALAATLRRTLPLGPVTRVEAALGDGTRIVAAAPAPPPGWLAARAPGDELAVSFATDRARPVGAAGPA